MRPRRHLVPVSDQHPQSLKATISVNGIDVAVHGFKVGRCELVSVGGEERLIGYVSPSTTDVHIVPERGDEKAILDTGGHSREHFRLPVGVCLTK